jgi:ornithine cyclodeaminase/alanine dehydrogenase-like protein (mu-crystallin family)
MLILNAKQVRQTLPPPVAIEAMKRAFLAISCGETEMPLRTCLDLSGHHGKTLVMPAHVHSGDMETLAVKIVSVFDDNPQRGLPRILATVLAIDPATGETIALIEGTTVTAIRTAAASAAATDVLARTGSATLAVIGAGVQAREHIAAIHCVRDIRKTYIAARDLSQSERLVRDLSSSAIAVCDITICETADEAVALADIVCTVTTSRDPVFSPSSVRRGTHINAVGSYQPDTLEIPPETVRDASVFVDHLASALQEAGDLIVPLKSGLIRESHIRGEIGEVLAGRLRGRDSETDITLFKSVGCAVEDCFAAREVLAAARELGVGQEFSLF